MVGEPETLTPATVMAGVFCWVVAGLSPPVSML
jgi:hypothetical protein